MELAHEIAASRTGSGNPEALVGEFRRTVLLVPMGIKGLRTVVYGEVCWIVAFTDEAALARYARGHGAEPDERWPDERWPDERWEALPVLGARLLDSVIPAMPGPAGVALPSVTCRSPCECPKDGSAPCRPAVERRPADENWAYTLHVPHDVRAVGIARATLRSVLVGNGLPELLDPAALLASELLTNAYLHSAGPASLRMRRTGGTLRLGVGDSDPHPPRVNRPGADQESGRGLLLVTVYADSWGWFHLGDGHSGLGGKFVWCELRGKGDPGDWDVAA